VLISKTDFAKRTCFPDDKEIKELDAAGTSKMMAGLTSLISDIGYAVRVAATPPGTTVTVFPEILDDNQGISLRMGSPISLRVPLYSTRYPRASP
jgi:hypothetical protein